MPSTRCHVKKEGRDDDDPNIDADFLAPRNHRSARSKKPSISPNGEPYPSVEAEVNRRPTTRLTTRLTARLTARQSARKLASSPIDQLPASVATPEVEEPPTRPTRAKRRKPTKGRGVKSSIATTTPEVTVKIEQIDEVTEYPAIRRSNRILKVAGTPTSDVQDSDKSRLIVELSRCDDSPKKEARVVSSIEQSSADEAFVDLEHAPRLKKQKIDDFLTDIGKPIKKETSKKQKSKRKSSKVANFEKNARSTFCKTSKDKSLEAEAAQHTTPPNSVSPTNKKSSLKRTKNNSSSTCAKLSVNFLEPDSDGDIEMDVVSPNSNLRDDKDKECVTKGNNDAESDAESDVDMEVSTLKVHCKSKVSREMTPKRHKAIKQNALSMSDVEFESCRSFASDDSFTDATEHNVEATRQPVLNATITLVGKACGDTIATPQKPKRKKTFSDDLKNSEVSSILITFFHISLQILLSLNFVHFYFFIYSHNYYW